MCRAQDRVAVGGVCRLVGGLAFVSVCALWVAHSSSCLRLHAEQPQRLFVTDKSAIASVQQPATQLGELNGLVKKGCYCCVVWCAPGPVKWFISLAVNDCLVVMRCMSCHSIRMWIYQYTEKTILDCRKQKAATS